MSGCAALETICCYDNQLASLDVRSCTALMDLNCTSNQLTSLDVRNCTALTDLYCYSNQLTSLDVSSSTALKYLSCYDNQLTSLDVSNCIELTYLVCESNSRRISVVQNRFDLSNLAADGFDISKASNWQGGTVNGTILTVAADEVTYTYDMGYSKTETFTLIIDGFIEPEKPNEFKDVPKNAYYYDAVMWAVQNKVTSGTGDGTTFEPNKPCTRGQVVTFLWRAAGEPEPKNTVNPFKDVKSSDYFYKAVLWAKENNITSGTGDGSTFEPHANCNRAQIVTFLSRAKNGLPTKDENPFKDVANNAYYYNSVLWAVENGITTGTGDGTTFEPNANCTRGQVITFLWRAYTK